MSGQVLILIDGLDYTGEDEMINIGAPDELTMNAMAQLPTVPFQGPLDHQEIRTMAALVIHGAAPVGLLADLLFDHDFPEDSDCVRRAENLLDMLGWLTSATDRSHFDIGDECRTAEERMIQSVVVGWVGIRARFQESYPSGIAQVVQVARNILTLRSLGTSPSGLEEVAFGPILARLEQR